MIAPPPVVAPSLGATVSEARKLAQLGLAGARGLSKSPWFAAGLFLAMAGFVIAVLLRERDPVLTKLSQAPIDEEPVTPKERADIDAARTEESIPWEQAKKDLAEPSRSRGKTTS